MFAIKITIDPDRFNFRFTSDISVYDKRLSDKIVIASTIKIRITFFVKNISFQIQNSVDG